MLRPCTAFTAALACCLIASCGSDTQVPPQVPPREVDEPKSSEVLISAAASTKELMEALAAEFSKKSKAKVKTNPGPSSGLANQIIAGAPAHLFLSANREWAAKVAQADLAESSADLLTNKLVLIVPKGNPGGVTKPDDLLSAQVKRIALAGEKVPAGVYADQALTKLDLHEKLTAAGKIARAQDVRGALSFVQRGEAEAGIVYSTDVALATGVETVYEFDPALHDEIVYVLVLLRHGAKNTDAMSFFEYLQTQGADDIYAQAGFSRIKQDLP
jgi:molybdate transport system substrate-binding protein